MKTLKNVIGLLLAILLVFAIIGIVTSSSCAGTDLDDGAEYIIEYILRGDVSNLSDVSVTGDKRAQEGETVSFKVNYDSESYSIVGMRVYGFNSDIAVTAGDDDGVYAFTMPAGHVYVDIYFKYIAVEGETLYLIGYDSKGTASMEVVDLICPDRAAASETVTFKAKIKLEYVDKYYISRIVVQLGSAGECYVDDLQSHNGTYTFVMPDVSTLEGEAEGYIELLFYILEIDM